MTWKRVSPHHLERQPYTITVGGIGNGLVSYLLHRGREIIAARPAIPADDRTARGRAVDELKTIAEGNP